MIAPILSVEPGMGDTVLILAFVVIVVGGIGSIRGAFLAALVIGTLIPTLWLAWLVYWWLSARNVKPTRSREPLAFELRHRAPLMLAALLLAAPRWLPRVLTRRFLPLGWLFPVLGVVLLATGLGFTVWARRHLGRNWSATVTIKEDHRLIRTGQADVMFAGGSDAPLAFGTIRAWESMRGIPGDMHSS